MTTRMSVVLRRPGCLNLYFCRRDYALSLTGTLVLNTLLLLLLLLLFFSILSNTIKWLAAREHSFHNNGVCTFCFGFFYFISVAGDMVWVYFKLILVTCLWDPLFTISLLSLSFVTVLALTLFSLVSFWQNFPVSCLQHFYWLLLIVFHKKYI